MTKRTVPEAAAELGVSERTMWRLVKCGMLRTFRPSPRKVYVLGPDLEKFVEKRTK